MKIFNHGFIPWDSEGELKAKPKPVPLQPAA